MLALHLMTLCGAGILIFLISYDAIRKISFLSDPRYINVQLWICLLFIVDILVEVAMSSRPLRSLVVGDHEHDIHRQQHSRIHGAWQNNGDKPFRRRVYPDASADGLHYSDGLHYQCDKQ